MVKHAKTAKMLPRGMFSLENRARQNQLTLKAANYRLDNFVATGFTFWPMPVPCIDIVERLIALITLKCLFLVNS